MKVRLQIAGRFLAAFAIAYALHLLLIALYPATLHTATRTVGYPIYANFNIDRFYWQMYLPIFFLPVATWFLFRAFGAMPARARVATSGFTQADTVERGLQRFIIGACLGMALPWASTASGTWFLLAGVTYAAAREYLDRRGRLFPNLDFLVGALSPFVLAWYSRNSFVVKNGVTIATPWFPVWLAVAVSAAFMAWFALSGSRRIWIRERYAWLLPMLVLVFLARAAVPGSSTLNDEFFHNGESLVSGRLLLEGWFPWRDFMFIHGLLFDPFDSALGYWLYGHNVWGATIGESLILRPLFFVLFLPLWFVFFRLSPLFVLFVSVLLPFGFQFQGAALYLERHLPYPLVLLALYGALKRPSFLSAVWLMSSLFVYAVLSPESSYLVPSVMAVLIGQAFFRYRSGKAFSESFRLTAICIAVGAVCSALWLLFLARHGALKSFFDYYLIFAKDHRFAGGLPLQSKAEDFRAIAYAPAFGIFVYSWYLAARWKRRHALRPLDWTLIAVSLYVILYYQKFVSRADWHVVHPYLIELPLLYFLCYRLFAIWDRQLRAKFPRLGLRHPASLAICGIFGFLWWGSYSAPIVRVTEHLQVPLESDTETGWRKNSVFNPAQTEMLAKYRGFFDAQLAPQDAIFDFTNAPLLYYILLERHPATRYFHVSMAIVEEAQKDLIAELDHERPKIVAYESSLGLGEWDYVPNMVRHYLVSEYLLRHYRPLATVEKTLFLVRNDLPDRTASDLPAYAFRECRWGFVPDFWRRPASDTQGLPFTTRALDDKTQLAEITLPKAERRAVGTLQLVLSGSPGAKFEMASSPAELEVPQARISFETREHRDTAAYPLEVGSCYAWYRWAGEKAYLRFPKSETLSAVHWQ